MFDDIRPYNDSEIPAAMQRIVADQYFPLVCDYLFPEKKQADIASTLLSCRSAEEFQLKFMHPAIYSLVDKTTDGLSVNGMDKLEKGKSYLFVSNHRDIVLDAAFLQILLVDAGLKTSEITFGANLMQGQLVIDFGRSNKMFRVERPNTVSSARDFLLRSQYLSAYIRYTITQKGESVWIAQRNGRTKDGLDATDQGIIKMFGMSGGEDRVQALAELNIVPLSISYEWEPCDILKALELYARQSGQPYIKKPGEDLNSILTGIRQPKGRVHMEVCDVLTAEDILPFENMSTGGFNREVAAIIDSRIRSGYRIWPNSYIAKDILSGKRSGEGYTPAQWDAFTARLEEQTKEYPEGLRAVLLEIYANPLSY